MGSLSSTITDRLDAAIGAGPAIAGDPKVVFALEVQGYDKNAAATATRYWTDVGFITGSGDTPASTHMPGRLIVPEMSASLVDASSVGVGEPQTTGEQRGLPGLRNFAPPEISQARVTNLDVDASTGVGPLDDLVDRALWSFAGRKAFLKVGAEDLAYTAFEMIQGGEFRISGEPTWSPEGDLLWAFDPPIEGFGKPFQKHIYGGFGAGLVFNGTTTWVDFGDEWNIGEQDACLQWRLRWPDNANQRIIAQKRATLAGGTDQGFSFYINTSKQLIFSASDGASSGSINMGAASAYDDDVHRMFTINYNAGTELEAFLSEFTGTPKVMTTTSLGTIDTSSWTGVITNDETLVMGSAPAGASDFFDGDMDEFRVWRKILTSAQINDSALQTMAGNENRLVACYKFDDRTAAVTTAWQEVVTGGLDSLLFNAGTEQISFGNVLNQDPTFGGAEDSFTFGVWAKCNTVSTEDFLFGNRSAKPATNAGYQLSLLDSSGNVSLKFEIDDGTSKFTATSTSAVYGRGVWHFFCGRCDATAKTIEAIVIPSRDITLEVSSTTDITGMGSASNANNLVIGRSAAGTLPLLCQVSHGFFLTSALTNSQIRDLARFLWDTDTLTMPGEGLAAEASDSAFWNFDEGTGATVADSWDGGRDGTITGATWATHDATINGAVAFATSLSGDAIFGERGDSSDIQGRRVPHAWGRFVGAECHLIDQADDGTNPATPWYQYADPLQANTKAIENVYSGGLILVGGGTDYEVPVLATSTINLTAPQSEVITADGKGYVDGSDNLIETKADIAAELFTLAGESTQNTASFTQLNIDSPYQVGLVTDLDAHLTEEVIDAHLRPDAWGTKNISGEILVGSFKNLNGETADFELTTSNIARNGVTEVLSMPPASRVDVAFRRNWRPLTSFLGAVSTPDQIRQSGHYWQVTAGGGSIKTEHEDALPVYVSSHIHRRRDAVDLAEKLRDIMNRPLQILRVQLVRDLFKAEIGDIVKLTYPRFGYSAGKLFLCVGYVYPKSPSLLLWGPFSL